MNFLKKIDHLKMLRFALGISIFSIGYLITMFYFQINDLKEYKERIIMYNTANVNMLQLESEIERDSYFAQAQVLNLNLTSQQTHLNSQYIDTFLEKNKFLKEIDSEVIEKNNKIKTLIKSYNLSKNQLLDKNSIVNTNKFNQSVINLIQYLKNYSIYLEGKIKFFNTNYDTLIDKSKTSGFLIALISLVIFVLSYVRMNEDLQTLRQINDDIIFMNENLSSAEMVAGFGSWKINTVQNKFIISDNFYRLLNLNPREVELTVDDVMKYIHPDDRKEVMKMHKDSFHNKETTTIMYRYLLADGTIKHMVSTGKFMNNSKGELIKIGVNQDITEMILKTKELEQNNAKLVSINSELESFNNIVSHDLQEPLRKIQMFISRIESKDFLEKSTETTITYFDKIKLAAKRMQALMTDLVDYTRTIKADRIVETVDLNLVLKNALEELSLSIEESSAKISLSKLPIILGTKFQLQQLFINIISNAIKYVNPDINPIISIQQIDFDMEIINNKEISNKDFYKITISDNGIGFDQKYAETIFMLFKRLETDYSYKGTGLGLAICKKIIDNHKGFITASSFDTEGSVFSIYLPKT